MLLLSRALTKSWLTNSPMTRDQGAGGVCSYAAPRPDLSGLGHHPQVTLVGVENGVRTFRCKACNITVIVPKDAKL